MAICERVQRLAMRARSGEILSASHVHHSHMALVQTVTKIDTSWP